ncbi:glycosyltransferase [Intrasporangium sp.]|uniref:glycosyltransferase n=1 Tax=Intrasporangium sp. TaxID=1925024 RepID=UPI003221CC7E
MRPWRSQVRGVKRLFRKVGKTLPIEWRAYVHDLPVDPDLVLFESFSGSGALCNPEALFRAMVADPEYSRKRLVWVLRRPRRHSAIQQEFAVDHRVSFVKYRSPAYFKVLATAGLLINNATFPPEFNKRPDQVYLNTWHGTPLKRMGFEEPDGAHASRNVLRNFLQADYLLSSGEYMTRRMYEDAYRLKNIYAGRYLELGFPRTDRQVLDDLERTDVRSRLAAAGLALEERIVLYAPTWRGSSFYRPSDDTALLSDRVRQIREGLPTGWVVLLKVHQQVSDFARRDPSLRAILVPNQMPTNSVLGVTDVLVTDYSSIFFDFLATRRPIVFFTPDQAEYEDERGLYLSPGNLPGPRVTAGAQVAALVRDITAGAGQWPALVSADTYEDAIHRFASHDDGNVSTRVLDVISRRATEGPGIVAPSVDGREKVLVFTGGMLSNGITSSALNILSSIDHDRFDVSAVYNSPRGSQRRQNAELIDVRVRRFERTGTFAISKRHRSQRRALFTNSAQLSPHELASMESLLRDEWYRCFGDTTFDYVIDFSGYSPFWSFLLSTAAARSHSIWLHNDLHADQMRLVDGRRPHEKNLGAVFASYRRYDHLVSVSDALRDINARELAAYAPSEKFVSARNTIEFERVLRMAHGDPEVRDTTAAVKAFARALQLGAGSPTAKGATEGHGRLTHDLETVGDEVARLLTIARIVPPREGVTTFVTVGRLSPEKNHERLIRAFALLHRQEPRTRLVLVGDGPLLKELERIAVQLGISKCVTFAGQQPNPFAIMSQSDVFVLSSDYEGQPMVILEARVLGLPVVSTNFESVRGALPDGVGRIVERDPTALAAGMLDALRGEVPSPAFDPAEYNASAVQEFYEAIGAAP